MPNGDAAAAADLEQKIARMPAQYNRAANAFTEISGLVEQDRQLCSRAAIRRRKARHYEVFSRLEADPSVESLRPIEPVARAPRSVNRKQEASEIMLRQLALLERHEGPNRPAFAQTLLQTASIFIRECMPELARELIDRAALIISATGGEECVLMEGVYDQRWQLLGIDGKYDGAMEPAAKLLQLRLRYPRCEQSVCTRDRAANFERRSRGRGEGSLPTGARDLAPVAR